MSYSRIVMPVIKCTQVPALVPYSLIGSNTNVCIGPQCCCCQGDVFFLSLSLTHDYWWLSICFLILMHVLHNLSDGGSVHCICTDLMMTAFCDHFYHLVQFFYWLSIYWISFAESFNYSLMADSLHFMSSFLSFLVKLILLVFNSFT